MAGQRALIYNNLSVTLAAGLPILRSIPTSISGMKGTIPTAFEALAKSVSIGDGLAETMAKYPRAFTQIDVLVVEAGEISGNLFGDRNSEDLILLRFFPAYEDRAIYGRWRGDGEGVNDHHINLVAKHKTKKPIAVQWANNLEYQLEGVKEILNPEH